MPNLDKDSLQALLGELPRCERYDSGWGASCGKVATRYRVQNNLPLCDDCAKSHHPDTKWAKAFRALLKMSGLALDDFGPDRKDTCLWCGVGEPTADDELCSEKCRKDMERVIELERQEEP